MINLSLQPDECVEGYYSGLMGFICAHAWAETCQKKQRSKCCSRATFSAAQQRWHEQGSCWGRVPGDAAPWHSCPRLPGALCAPAVAVAPWQAVSTSWDTANLGPPSWAECHRSARDPPPVSWQPCPSCFLSGFFLFPLNSGKCLTQNMVRLGMRSVLCYHPSATVLLETGPVRGENSSCARSSSTEKVL